MKFRLTFFCLQSKHKAFFQSVPLEYQNLEASIFKGFGTGRCELNLVYEKCLAALARKLGSEESITHFGWEFLYDKECFVEVFLCSAAYI